MENIGTEATRLDAELAEEERREARESFERHERERPRRIEDLLVKILAAVQR